MIVNFFGCPRSGKTTTAARVFSNLKEANFTSEFVPEQARLFIAKKKVATSIKFDEQLTLTDENQYEIMLQQYSIEQLMLKSCGSSSIIVTDSSPLNALLYMSESFRETPKVKKIVELTLKNKLCNFYASPVNWLGAKDPNRIHSFEQSLDIDKQISKVILPLLTLSPTILIGDTYDRQNVATSTVLQAIMNM